MLIYSIFIAFCGSFLFGYTTCVIAGALLFLIQEFHLSHLQEGTLVSIILFGAMIGSIIGGLFHDRRHALIWTGLIFMIGILLSTINRFEILLIGRAITGIGVGLSSMIVPIYLAEISPAHHRGKIGSMAMLGIAVGLFSAYIVNYMLSESGNWQLMFGIGVIPACLLFIGMFFAIDPPNQNPLNHQQQKNIKLWNSSFRYLVIIGALLSLAQQATGINVVNYYAPKIFQTAGFQSPQAATYATLVIGFITVLASLVTTVLIDKWGRRPHLFISLIGMALTLGILSNAYYFHSHSIGLIALITLPTYTAAFTIGMGSALWVYLSEMYPSSIRSKAMSIAVLINWMSNYCISLIFPLLASYWGIGGVFALFSILSLIICFFIRLLPETKGKELI